MMSSSSSDGDGTIIDPKESRIKNRGKSDIETLARTIDDRLQNRLRVSLWERKKFLDICFEIAKKEEESRNGSLSRFSKEGLVILVKELKGASKSVLSLKSLSANGRLTAIQKYPRIKLSY